MNSRRVPVKPPLKQHQIAMKAVESSAIKSIGHHAASNTLRVEFHTGGIYDYPDVTADDHKAIMAAESKGRHLMQHIRHRAFTKLPEAA